MNKKVSRINHFILWCKNWYHPINKDEGIFETARRALYLDGYTQLSKPVQVLSIVFNALDDMIDKGWIDGRRSELRMAVFNSEIRNNMNLYNVDYNTATLHTLRHFFAWGLSKSDIDLTPPVYNRSLYKLGFKSNCPMGTTYKQMNNQVKEFFV